MNYNKDSQEAGIQEVTRKYLKALKPGSILLATEKLPDPNFNNSLVLICMHESDGTFGLICNRTSNMPLREIFSGNNKKLSENRIIHIGGPVNQETLNIVQITKTARNKALKVTPDISIGGEWESVESIIDSDPDTTRLFLGYSGWAKGQLEQEITVGAWEVYNTPPEEVLKNTDWFTGKRSSEIREYLRN